MQPDSQLQTTYLQLPDVGPQKQVFPVSPQVFLGSQLPAYREELNTRSVAHHIEPATSACKTHRALSAAVCNETNALGDGAQGQAGSSYSCFVDAVMIRRRMCNCGNNGASIGMQVYTAPGSRCRRWALIILARKQTQTGTQVGTAPGLMDTSGSRSAQTRQLLNPCRCHCGSADVTLPAHLRWGFSWQRQRHPNFLLSRGCRVERACVEMQTGLQVRTAPGLYRALRLLSTQISTRQPCQQPLCAQHQPQAQSRRALHGPVVDRVSKQERGTAVLKSAPIWPRDAGYRLSGLSFLVCASWSRSACLHSFFHACNPHPPPLLPRNQEFFLIMVSASAKARSGARPGRRERREAWTRANAEEQQDVADQPQPENAETWWNQQWRGQWWGDLVGRPRVDGDGSRALNGFLQQLAGVPATYVHTASGGGVCHS